MGLFTKKNRTEETEQQHDERVEIVVSKEANKDIANKAKESNTRLNDLLKQNHFHIKIYLAAGGHQPKGKLKGAK